MRHGTKKERRVVTLEELLKTMIDEQKRTNELLMYGYQGKNPNELLTVEQIHEEFKIGIITVRKMFQDKSLPVQRYTTPFKVTRKAFNDYINKNHDYLSER